MDDLAAEALGARELGRVALVVAVVAAADVEEAAGQLRPSRRSSPRSTSTVQRASARRPAGAARRDGRSGSARRSRTRSRSRGRSSRIDGPVGDRLRLRPGPERVAEREHVGVRADARVAEQVPGAADRLARLEDRVALAGALGLQVVGGADAGEAGADDQDVEVLGSLIAIGESGEGGIRTRERACAPYSLSRRVPSATRPPLLGGFCAQCRYARSRCEPAARRSTARRSRLATTRSSPGSRRRSRSSTSTRCARNARRDARAGGRAADPGRLEVGALDRGPAPDPRARPGFRGVLAFTAARGALARGRTASTDIVVAYPTVDRARDRAGSRGSTAEDPERAPVLMVDDRPHLDLIEGAIGGGPAPRARLPRRRRRLVAAGRADGADRPEALAGPRPRPRAGGWPARSPSGPGTALAGVMAYEGQIAGVGDRIPGQSAAKRRDPRRCSRRSERDIRERLPRNRRGRPRGARPSTAASSSSSTAAAPAASRAPPAAGDRRPSSPPARASTRRRCSTTTAR